MVELLNSDMAMEDFWFHRVKKDGMLDSGAKDPI